MQTSRQVCGTVMIWPVSPRPAGGALFRGEAFPQVSNRWTAWPRGRRLRHCGPLYLVWVGRRKSRWLSLHIGKRSVERMLVED